MLTYTMTYSIVTPESAETGSESESGWIIGGRYVRTDDDPEFHADPRGWCDRMGVTDSIELGDPDDYSDQYTEITRDPTVLGAFTFLICSGLYYPSIDPVRPTDEPSWSSNDGVVDYATGADRTRTVHFGRGELSPRQRAELLALLLARPNPFATFRVELSGRDTVADAVIVAHIGEK